jgi:transcriptional regulator with XRE-family HTH domain
VSKKALGKDIKKRLILFCKENKITQDSIAKSIDTTKQNINRWFNLNDTSVPSLWVIKWLMDNYNMNVFWALTGKGSLLAVNDGVNQFVGENNTNILQTANSNGKDCSDCSIVKGLIEQNKKLTEKLLEKL